MVPKFPVHSHKTSPSQRQQGKAIKQFEGGVMSLMKGEDEAPSLP